MVCALRGGMARSGARAYAARAGGGGASRCRSTVTVGPDRRRPPRAARRVFGVQFARRATAVIPSRSSSTARRRASVSERAARIVHVASPRARKCSTLAGRFHADFLAAGKVIPRGATLATVASIVASMGKLASMGYPTVDVQTLAPQALTNASAAIPSACALAGVRGAYRCVHPRDSDRTRQRHHRDGDTRRRVDDFT